MKNIDLVHISRLDLNLVVTFLAIWQERSVSKAATKLSLSQSAVSAALTRLRDVVGDPLFIRTRGGMEPTPRAIAMAEKLDGGLALIRGALQVDEGFDPARSSRHFSLGMSDDYELAIGPAISRRLQAEAPGLSLVFRQSNRYTVEAMLDSGQIDLAVASGAPQRSWLVQQTVTESGFACLLDPEQCGVDLPLSLEDFLGLAQILISFSGREGMVDTALKPLGRTRRIHTALTHFSAAPAFLRRMRAVATIPSHAAAALADERLRVCPPPFEMGTYPVAIVTRRDAAADPGLSWLAGVVRQALVDACGEGRPTSDQGGEAAAPITF